MPSINNLNSALTAIENHQTLRVDADGGNLHEVKGFEKFSLAFQKNVLKKTPDQLGTSQAKIAGALVGLYKNEKPGVSNQQVAKFLDRLGFTEFAALLKKSPDLSARQATVEKGPAFEETAFHDDENVFGTFTKKDPQRAGSADTPSAKAVETHVPAAEIDQIVKALNLNTPEAPPAPTPAPRTKAPTAAPRANPQASTQNVSQQASGPLPEYLASPEEISQALSGLQNQKAAKGPSSDRLAAAASHGREIAAQKAAPATTSSVAPPTKDIKAQIADIENRLKLADEGKHLNAEGTRARPFKPGEKEAEVKELTAKLASLKQTSAPAKPANPAAHKLVADLKSGAVNDANFGSAVFELIKDRLGAKAKDIVQTRDAQYYHHLGSDKARYKDIGVPKDTAISLKNGEVFHANHIPLGGFGKPAIATQAPLLGTVSSFVSLIEEQNVTTIVDLTNVHDRENRLIPDYARKSDYGFKSADKTSPELQGAGIEKRELKTAKEHSVSYLNFTNWPDKGVIQLNQLQGLVSAIGQEHGNKAGGFAIHCTAGVGRTGTVYAALELDRLAKSGDLNKDNFADKVLDVVAEGRKARGFAFVQAPGQLSLLFDFAKTLV
jgi:protein tyrosine phosphatase